MASFPCSNAPGERIFSSLKLIKNEKRCVKSETLVALMQRRFAIKLSSQSAESILDDKKLPPPPRLADIKGSATDNESADL